MPLAQKRPSSAAPGICLRNSSEKAPCTVEMLTPTFSNTRPRMTDMTPPPPGLPSSVGRRHSVRSKRPAGRSARVPVRVVLQRFEGGADPVAQFTEPGGGLACAGRRSAGSCSSNRKSFQLPQRFADHHGAGHRDIERPHAPPASGCVSRSVGSLMHRRRHAAAFAAQQQRIAGGEGEIGIGRRGPGGQQQQAPGGARAARSRRYASQEL